MNNVKSFVGAVALGAAGLLAAGAATGAINVNPQKILPDLNRECLMVKGLQKDEFAREGLKTLRKLK